MQQGAQGLPMFDIPGMPGAAMGAINLGDMFGKAFGGRTKTRRTTVVEAYAPLLAEESDKLLDQDAIVQEAIQQVENNGIVFLDEIDKICAREGRGGADVSREGVQRDLLPLIEGTTVATKHGAVKTDHILFIASGAFHVSKPSDLLPELQGRLPIRVELASLTVDDFRRILTETEASLIKQYGGADARRRAWNSIFTDDSIDALARSRRSGEQLGGEYRRPPAANRARAGARRDLVHGSGPFRRNHDHRRRLCAQRGGKPCTEYGSEPIHPVGPHVAARWAGFRVVAERLEAIGVRSAGRSFSCAR